MQESSNNPNLVPLTLNKRIESVRDEDCRKHGTTSFKEYLFESEREKHDSIINVLRSRSKLIITSDA